jgi:hypothetical protein
MSEVLRSPRMVALALAVGLGASACGGKKEATPPSVIQASTPIEAIVPSAVPHNPNLSKLDHMVMYAEGPNFGTPFQTVDYGDDAIIRFLSDYQRLRYCNDNELEEVFTTIDRTTNEPAHQTKKHVANAPVCDDGKITASDYPSMPNTAIETEVFWPNHPFWVSR